jgi:CheY-like chemotaxis protein
MPPSARSPTIDWARILSHLIVACHVCGSKNYLHARTVQRKHGHTIRATTGVKRMSQIRVLLADDHEMILAQVRVLLGKDFDIVGAVSNGRDAVVEVQRLDPDVLVIDISMPVLDGLHAVSQLRFTNCRTKVVFLTVHEDQDFVVAAFSAGASGYVSKSDIARDLVPAIREVMQGRSYVSQSVPQ